jgi:uncharacterized glyoxalase superfamily protein PhnB
MRAVAPSLVVRRAAEAIEFYKKVFGAEEITRLLTSDGRVWHCEVRIGDSVVFISDELPGSSVKAPSPDAFTSTIVRVYVPDADATFRRAIDAGARSLRDVSDVFWGDRMGIVADPFGHVWAVSTHVRDVGLEEMQRAAEELSLKSGLQRGQAGIPGP